MFDLEEYFDDILPYIEDGKVDKSLAPLTWYRLNAEFNLPVGRMSTMANVMGGDTPHWSLKKDDVIAFGSMLFQDTDKSTKRGNIVVKGDGEEIQFFGNTRKFFDINHKIFNNITLQIERDKKINQLL